MLLNKKIWKFNILDLFIIFMVILLGIGGVYKIKKSNISDAISPKPIELKIMVKEREQFGIDLINRGDILKEYDTGIILGEIKEIEIKPAVYEVVTSDGEVKLAEVPDRYDLFISIDGEALITNNSIISGKSELRIGNKLVLKSKWYALDSIILEIDTKKD